MKKGLSVVLAACMTLSLAVPVFGAQPGWEQREEGWYYCLGDNEQGEPQYLRDALTPDGYYVNGDGIWYPRKTTILDQEYAVSERFVPVNADWSGFELASRVADSVFRVFGGSRAVQISDSSIVYRKQAAKKGESAKVVMGLYKEDTAGRYRLDLQVGLDSETQNTASANYYNYQVFKALLSMVSSTPELLEQAVYQAWEGENGWNIGRTDWVRVGDSMVKFASADGCGRFYIAPAAPAQ